ncbi:MAG: hypothetical protein JNM76_06825 [Betaproteobacteria bacterium]|nr:hypothetical protein [Betaproteobacteria bacterium]
MKPIDPTVGKVVAAAWASYQVFADRERAQRPRAMTESEAAQELLALFRGPLPPPPETAPDSAGIIEMRRLFDASDQ